MRDLRSNRIRVAPSLTGARVLAQGYARFRARPLIDASGAFDCAAIMAAASYAADRLQERFGLSRRESISTALKAAWQAAKIARSAGAH